MEKEAPNLFNRFKFFIRNNDKFYRNILNFKFRTKKLKLQPNKQLDSIVSKLFSDGIAFAHVNDIFGSQLGSELFTSAQKWIESEEKNLRVNPIKQYLFSYLEPNWELDFSNPILKFYLSPEFIYVASNYLGYVPQLNEFIIEKTIPVGSVAAVQSQNWHRDPQEKRTLKIFLYLSDVSSDSGPFIYVKHSSPTSKGKYSRIAPQVLPKGSYPDPHLIEQTVSNSDICIANAQKGTIIFCDTSGIHKGGYAKANQRIMATGFYPSKFYTKGKNFKLNQHVLGEIGKTNTLAKNLF